MKCWLRIFISGIFVQQCVLRTCGGETRESQVWEIIGTITQTPLSTPTVRILILSVQKEIKKSGYYKPAKIVVPLEKDSNFFFYTIYIFFSPNIDWAYIYFFTIVYDTNHKSQYGYSSHFFDLFLHTQYQYTHSSRKRGLCYRAYFPHLGVPGFSTTRSQYALDKNTRYKYSEPSTSYLI